jgi:sodium transport system permease protein
LEEFETQLANKFDVNTDLNINYDLATEEDMSVKIIGMILPFILITFLFSGAMGICSESIAGEKERGTIATLLVTPIRRRDLVIGKVAALGITSMTSAFVSFIGLILSIPKLAGTDFSFSAYGFGALVLLFFVVIITALLFTTLLTIISTYAKSVKEASGLAVPLMMVVMLSGMTGMMSGGANTNLFMYLIPVYNSIQSLTGILNQSFNVWASIITLASNAVYISLGVYLLTKMFNSEKVMFSK